MFLGRSELHLIGDFHASFIAGGSHAGDAFKNTVEIGEIGKAAALADLCDGKIRFPEFSLGVHDSCGIDILRNRTICCFLEFSAEIELTDIKLPGQ